MLGDQERAPPPATLVKARIHVCPESNLFYKWRSSGAEFPEQQLSNNTAMAAAICSKVIEATPPGATAVLDDDMRSISSVKIGDNHTGLFDVDVRADMYPSFCAWAATHSVLCLATMNSPSAYFCVPKELNVGIEIDRFIRQVPVEANLIIGDLAFDRRRYGLNAAAVPVLVADEWLRAVSQTPGVLTFTNGTTLNLACCKAREFGKVETSYAIVEGLAGSGGRKAAVEFVERLLGDRVTITINNNSIEKGSVGTLAYTSSPRNEALIDSLLEIAPGIDVPSPYGQVDYISVAMDFPSIMVSRSEKRSRGRADRIGSSRWMVVEDPAPAMAKQELS